MAKSLRSSRHRKLQRILREARLAAGLTQEELATRLERPQSFIAKIEIGERRIDVVEFCDWVVQVGEEPSELIAALTE